MKLMIITIAGMSTRFAASVNALKNQAFLKTEGEVQRTIKSLYNEGDIQQSLLYRLLHKARDIDKFIIVGGYGFDELSSIIDSEFVDYRDRIILVNNEKYEDYGSGFSLYKGLERAFTIDFDEIIFAEGDLFFDDASFEKIKSEKNNVLTICNEPINAEKAVALYTDENGFINYIYDTEHGSFTIDRPFVGIYNSGQVWKFYEANRVRSCFDKLKESEWQGTNLAFIQKYFGELNREEYTVVSFKEWINCNTVEDWKEIQNYENNTGAFS